MPTGIYKRTKKPFWLGKKRPEIGKKVSLAKMGHIVSKETRLKQSFAKLGKPSNRKGKHHTQAAKEKNRQSKLGKKFSLETRLKMSSSARKGENSNFWKGGITPVNARIRTSLEYKIWRRAVFERDKYTCVWCKTKGYLEADHIKPFALYPELRFAIDNGRTLCKKCHSTTDTYKGLSKNYKNNQLL